MCGIMIGKWTGGGGPDEESQPLLVIFCPRPQNIAFKRQHPYCSVDLKLINLMFVGYSDWALPPFPICLYTFCLPDVIVTKYPSPLFLHITKTGAGEDLGIRLLCSCPLHKSVTSMLCSLSLSQLVVYQLDWPRWTAAVACWTTAGSWEQWREGENYLHWFLPFFIPSSSLFHSTAFKVDKHYIIWHNVFNTCIH